MQDEKAFWNRPLVVVAVAATLAFACAQPTHEERVAEARSKYEATLNGFVVEQEPVAPVGSEMPAGGEAAGEEAEGGEAADEMAGDDADAEATEGDAMGAETQMGAPDETVSVRQEVLLDIVIRHDSAEKLPGITVDITMADGERELETWRVWFDTSDLEKGPGIQYTHTLEDVDYEPGYGFNAEIRHPVPPQERSQYREFQPAAP